MAAGDQIFEKVELDAKQMPVLLESFLGWLYPKIPPGIRPVLKGAFQWLQIRLTGLVSGLRVRKGRRIAFVDFEIAYLEPFEYLGPGKAEIEVVAHYSTVSPGTERAVLSGLPGARRGFPYFPGYSSAGEIRAVGASVKDFSAGDRVAGRVKHVSGDSVPAEYLFRVPKEVSLEAASLIELGIIVLQGVRKAKISPGDSVAVLGQGLIGQLANRVVRAVGASSVIAIAPSRNRAATALSPGGATDFISMSECEFDPVGVAADIVIEAVGTADAILAAARCARPGGKVVLLGSSRGLSRSVDLGALLRARRVTMLGAHISDMPKHEASPGRHTYRQEGELFLEMLRSGRLTVSELVTWRPDPADCNAVYEILARGGRDHVAIVFDWQRGEVARPLSATSK